MVEPVDILALASQRLSLVKGSVSGVMHMQAGPYADAICADLEARLRMARRDVEAAQQVACDIGAIQ